MIKIVPHNAWPEMGQVPVDQIKIAACGLRGNDFAAFVKRASHPLALWVREHAPKPGEVYVHNIALGATEKWGQNRNHDAYSAEMLKRDHPSFEKFAHWYRLHKNKDPLKSYGVIKKAFWNPDLMRVETIAALNATKEAAERNKGLVADKELDTLNANRDLAVSQSVKVSHDVCTGCGHKAKHRGEYCTAEMCKYGGCRENLGRSFEDGHVQAVDNPDGVFFDLSNVSKDLGSRGADRTAFVTGKVAASDRLPGGAELAEMLNLVPPDYLLDPRTIAAVGCLRKLAEAPKQVPAPAPSWEDALTVREGIAGKDVKQARCVGGDTDRHALVAELTADGVILPPARWLGLVTGSPVEKCAAVFAGGVDPDALLKSADLHEILAAQPAPAEAHNRLSAPGTYAWMAPGVKAMAKEAALAVLAGSSPLGSKSAACAAVPPAVRKEAALRYLGYQASVLAAHQNSVNFPLMLVECLRHNSNLTA